MLSEKVIDPWIEPVTRYHYMCISLRTLVITFSEEQCLMPGSKTYLLPFCVFISSVLFLLCLQAPGTTYLKVSVQPTGAQRRYNTYKLQDKHKVKQRDIPSAAIVEQTNRKVKQWDIPSAVIVEKQLSLFHPIFVLYVRTQYMCKLHFPGSGTFK